MDETPTHSQSNRPLYVFLNQGGNFDFSPSGSRFFTLTALRAQRPFTFEWPLHELRFDLIESGLNLEYLHASNDRQAVRDEMFRRVVLPHLSEFRAEILVVDKASIPTESQQVSVVSPWFVGLLMSQVIHSVGHTDWPEVIVITDRVPVARKRAVIEKAVKTRLAQRLPDGVCHRPLHHDSKSSGGLQIADYINWAVYRRWTSGDSRSSRLVQASLSETLVQWSTGIK